MGLAGLPWDFGLDIAGGAAFRRRLAAGVIRGELLMRKDDYLKVVSQIDVGGIETSAKSGSIVAADKIPEKRYGVTTSGLDDPQFWTWRAQAAEMLASEINEEYGKAAMLRIAKEYHSLAAHCVLKLRTTP